MCGCFFSLGYGSCKLKFFFSLLKVFIIFYVNNNSKKILVHNKLAHEKKKKISKRAKNLVHFKYENYDLRFIW